MCKLLYRYMGFNTHYEIILRNKSYITTFKSHDISDIDVYGYNFNADLSFFQIGAECKSGENSALDELYKFMGIASFYKLNKAYLIKTKIHQNARQIAHSHNVICLTESEIRKMLLGFTDDVDKQIKIEHAKYKKLTSNITAYKVSNEKLIDYITIDFWNRENWRSIHNIIHILKSNSNQKKLFPEKSLLEKYIHYYTVELFCYLVLKNSSEAIILNYSDFESACINCLYGGAEALNEKRRIHDAVNIATQSNKPFEPEWQADFVNICTRLTLQTSATSKIPAFIQDVYENCFYEKGIKIDQKLVKKYPDITRKFIQDIMQFLIKHCNVDDKIFEEFMQL